MIDFFVNLNPIYQALLAGIFTWLITLLGASIVFFFKKINNTILNLTMGFSAGIMIAASFFSLIEPAINMAKNLKMTSYLVVSIGFIIGIFIIVLGEKIYDSILKNRNKKVDDSKKRCLLLIGSISLHNIPEGLVIGVGFGSLIYNIPGSSLIAATTLALGIGIQNFPEGCAISLPLRREGYSTFKAFFLGQLSAIVEPISAVVGALLVIRIKILLPYLLALAAGCMMYVVISELIPESQNNKNKYLTNLITLLGFIIMMILDLSLG